MPQVDVIELWLLPEFKYVNDPNTIAGRIWAATIQYIFRFNSSIRVYTSTEIENYEHIWIFLEWVDPGLPRKSDRDTFFASSLGISMMTAFLRRPPRVFSLQNFPEGHLRDEKTCSMWVFRFDKSMNDEANIDKQYINGRFNDNTNVPQAFGTFQDDKSFHIYKNADVSKVFFFGMLRIPPKQVVPPWLDQLDRDDQLTSEDYTVILHREEQDPQDMSDEALRSKLTTTEAVVRTKPTDYVRCTYENRTYAPTIENVNGITFRPMHALAAHDWFQHQWRVEPSVESDPRRRYLEIFYVHLARPCANIQQAWLFKIRDQLASLPGLLQLAWDDTGTDNILSYYFVWESASSSQLVQSRSKAEQILQSFSASTTAGPLRVDSCYIDEGINWEDHTELEAVEMSFKGEMTKTERRIVEYLIESFVETLRTFVKDEISKGFTLDGPFWVHRYDSTSETCLLFFTWDPSQRKSIYTKFKRDSFEATGHTAHSLWLACPDLRSKPLKQVRTETEADDAMEI